MRVQCVFTVIAVSTWIMINGTPLNHQDARASDSLPGGEQSASSKPAATATSSDQVDILGMAARQIDTALNGGVDATSLLGDLVNANSPQNTGTFTYLLLHPPVKQPPDIVSLTAVEKLGKNLLYDITLSKTEGMACATCHVPVAGFTGPRSLINYVLGVMPGVIPGRFGNRRPQMIAYATYSPYGPFFNGAEGGTYLGGSFWDGRARDLIDQAEAPFINPNEMANKPVVGPYPPLRGGYSPDVVEKVKSRPYASLFEEVYGKKTIANATDRQFYHLIARSIASYEASVEVNQFSSKLDSSKYGNPPSQKYQLTVKEEMGRRLFFGKAQCSQCHSSGTLDEVAKQTHGKDVFTMYCYANIGVPKNPDNPFYKQTDAHSNPHGYNPLGADFIDFGLGSNPNPAPDGTRFMTSTPGDIAEFRGLFKAPSLRNVDARPYAGFDKAYMHNGVFKSLKHVVHFYNKRNIAVNSAGDEVSFDLRTGPPGGYTALFPLPEVLDNVQNVAGVPPSEATADVESNGQIGNLQLTANEEAAIIAFLKILTDGFTTP